MARAGRELAEPATPVQVEGINYFADTLLFAGVVLALASAAPLDKATSLEASTDG